LKFTVEKATESLSFFGCRN